MENQTIQPNDQSKKLTRRYSAEQKQQLIEQWKQSGLSRQTFCRQHAVGYYTMLYWTKKKRNQKKYRKGNQKYSFMF